MSDTSTRRTVAHASWVFGLGVVAVVSFAAGAARAQGVLAQPRAGAQANTHDARWLPWLGCWQEITDRRAPDDMRVCVTPDETGAGVRMTTRSGLRTLIQDSVIADGVERAVDEAEVGCRGSRRVDWSLGGERVFTRADLTCDAQPFRRVSGVSLITRGPTWIDIQHVEAEDNESVRVRRYRRVGEEGAGGAGLTPELEVRALAAASAAAANSLTVDDVVEAQAKISSAAVEAAIVETGARFVLDRATLIALDEAGVDEDVIDLMVAQSFPGRFVVQHGSAPRVEPDASTPLFGPFDFDPWWYGTYYPYYYYSPFGYSYWGRYGGFSPLTYVVIEGGGGGRDTITPRGAARVINGVGYTRVRSREDVNREAERSRHSSRASDGGGSGASSSGSSSSGASSSGSSSSGGGSSGTSSGGGSMSPQGASSGGGDSGRTAQPR